jgi:hypothetical protein
VKKKKLFQTGIKFAISAALIVWILQGVDLEEIFDMIGAANVFILLFAFLFKLSGYLISAIRWRILLRAQGADATIPFLISSYWVGFFFNNILPSSIGGDVVRIYDSWRAGAERATALTIVFVDRFLGVLALMLITLVMLLIPSQLTSGLPLSWLAVLLGLIGMVVLCWLIFVTPRSLSDLVSRFQISFLQKINATLIKIATAFEVFQQKKGALIKGLLLSLALQVNVILYHYIVAVSLHLDVPFYSYFITIPVITLITTLPISINGIGVRENLFIFFFAMFSVPKTEAFAYSLLLYGILLIQGLIGGLVYALRREGTMKMQQQPALEVDQEQ